MLKRLLLIVIVAALLLSAAPSYLYCAQQLTPEHLEKKWLKHFQEAENQLNIDNSVNAQTLLDTCQRILIENDATLSGYYFRTLALLGEMQFRAGEKDKFQNTLDKYESIRAQLRPCSKKMTYYLFYGAVLSSSAEDYTASSAYADEALMCTETLQNIDGMQSKLYHQIAYNYYQNNQIDLAIFNERQAIAFDSNNTSLYHITLLHYLFQAKQWEAFEDELPMCYSYAKEPILRIFSQSNESQRVQYWNLSEMFFSGVILNYAFAHPSKQLSAYSYNAALFSKGILLEAVNTTRNLLLKSGNEDIIQMYHHYLDLKSIENKTLDEQVELEAIEDVIVRYQKEHKYDFRDKFRCDWRMVKEKLPTNAIAIEFVSFPLDDGTIQYAAIVVKEDLEMPIFIPLCKEKQLSSIPKNQYYITSKLFDLIWLPLINSLTHVDTIYFAPSGLLHQVAIEAIPYDEDHTMADVYNLVRLSSTRELVFDKHTDTRTTATLYGGIQYNVEMEELLAESEQYTGAYLLASRCIENDTLNRGNVKYLPGTKREVEQINQLLQSSNLQVQIFTATSANEESFKALSGTRQNILHIATHGFYWSDSAAQKKEYFLQRMLIVEDDQYTPPSIDPLNRCGLLMAGANTALSGHSADLPEGVQDGILTAKEISLLDLRDANLVVLSACETGNGEITSEGVFGLQRAFKQAGAQTIIMSLWPVNDAATQLLMTEFYRNWITNHQSKREAFHNAQNTVRSRFEEPVYWAAFVLLDSLD